MRKKHAIGFFLTILMMFAFGLSACNSPADRSYEQETVRRYAELSLLYEKEKMIGKKTDSVYQSIVGKFFEDQQIRQEEFKQQIEDISDDPVMWKFFIQDVTVTIDSIKLYGTGKQS